MKKLFTLLVICASLQVQAQVHKNLAPEQRPEVARILAAQIARGNSAMPSAKGTQVKQRLVGFSYRNIGGPVLDSAKLYYSGYNGADSLKGATWGDYSDEIHNSPQSGKSRILFDSLVGWNTTNITPYTKTRNYDAFKNITFFEFSNPNVGSCFKSISTYSTFGKQITEIGYQGCINSLPNYWGYYNSNGNIIKDSFLYAYKLSYYSGQKLDSTKTVNNPAQWNGIRFIKWLTDSYVYTNNRLSVIYYYEADSLNTLKDTTYTSQLYYDALGRIDSVVMLRQGGIKDGIYIYKYSGNFPRESDIQLFRSDRFSSQPLALVLQYHYQYHLNSTGNWDTVYFHRVTNGMDTLYEKAPIIYNAAGFIDYVSRYAYNFNTNTFSTTPYDCNQYYYETYNDPTAVQSPVLSASTLKLFPNPVRDQLHILCTGAWDISDANGRVIASGHAPGVLNVANWPTGIYYLRSNNHADKFIKE